MRGKAGDRVVLFDGGGAEYTAQVEQIGRATVELTVLARVDAQRELPYQLTLGVALPKGDRQKWLVEKAVELGVTRLAALDTSRGVAQPAASTLARLERAVIEAAKQCGRNRLMEVSPAQSWNDYLRAAPPDAWRFVAHPGAAQSAAELFTERPGSSAVFLAIGPEGGLADEEIAAAQQAGWQLVDLGPRILRIETAAVLLVALVTLAQLERREAGAP
jgi:16S rRNA (uracil1498-N3)-methyltransferase